MEPNSRADRRGGYTRAGRRSRHRDRRSLAHARALRNRLIHGYLGVDDDTLWSIVHDDLPPLQAALARLLAQEDPER
ncbi:MAG: HepT-like ribonuclease domain-containing protein [Burkholderiaceae bacterium]